jgi:hypothetical protein
VTWNIFSTPAKLEKADIEAALTTGSTRTAQGLT